MTTYTLKTMSECDLKLFQIKLVYSCKYPGRLIGKCCGDQTMTDTDCISPHTSTLD